MQSIAKVYLASQSSRRKALLEQIGVEFIFIEGIDVDETPLIDEDPRDYVQRIALAKGQAGKEKCGKALEYPILSADTVVLLNNKIILKPKDFSNFKGSLKKLAGETHEVLTCVSLLSDESVSQVSVTTQVTMRKISEREMQFYWDNYHPYDKSGGYGIQDFASVFIENINGSYSNVVGLPLFETYQLLNVSVK